ncbi:hypothetical protein TSAR_016461 [Trichomalopsis sarcophagae]|uniref:Uncharacterized protein n=1 Tax=Trichomalopsis sarcophagae TaxID=543379 RepID=A0A232EVN4_9HYME|nr:hypothetical protein TSAR_016461 [Trichomalopsis sarcophagae]
MCDRRRWRHRPFDFPIYLLLRSVAAAALYAFSGSRGETERVV